MKTSLHLVEEFFALNSHSITNSLVETPADQLNELACRIIENNGKNETQLWGRSGSGVASPPQRKISAPPETIYLHDETYTRAGKDFSLSSAPALKHLILYCTNIALPDPLLDWANEFYDPNTFFYDPPSQSAGSDCALAYRQLEPLKGALEDGYVTLVGSPKGTSMNIGMYQTLDDIFLFKSNSENDLPDVCKIDPLLAWVLVHGIESVEPWELDRQELHQLSDITEAASLVLERTDKYGVFNGYGEKSGVKWPAVRSYYEKSGLSIDLLEDSALYGIAVKRLRCTPFVTRSSTRAHLLHNSRLDIGYSPRFADSFAPALGSLETSVTYALPGVENTSLQRILELRRDEEVFAELRESLEALSRDVARFGEPDNYVQYQRHVAAAAEDHVRAKVEILAKKIKRKERWNVAVGMAITSAVKMTFAGVAALLTGPAAPITTAVGNAAATGAKSQIKRSSQKALEARRTSLTLMTSLLSDTGKW